MYLFILESIGTSELLLIGLVALIVFGPRKIPEIARTAGKFMSEFRRSTDDFKKTWEREAGLLDDFAGDLKIDDSAPNRNIIKTPDSRNIVTNENDMVIPEIKEINYDRFDGVTRENEISDKVNANEIVQEKRDWL